MGHQHVTGQSSEFLEDPLGSSLVARKRPRLESPCLATDATTSSGGTHSAPNSPIIHSVAPNATSCVANIDNDCAQEEEMHDDQQDSHDGNEDDQEMRQAAGDEDGENRRQFFRFEVDSAQPLGVNALPPAREVSILWQVGTVTEGSQAEELGIEVSSSVSVFVYVHYNTTTRRERNQLNRLNPDSILCTTLNVYIFRSLSPCLYIFASFRVKRRIIIYTRCVGREYSVQINCSA